MGTSSKVVAKMSIDEFCTPPKCNCGKPIEEHPDEQYTIDKKPVCSDCYYQAFGEEVEKHPICAPHYRAKMG